MITNLSPRTVVDSLLPTFNLVTDPWISCAEPSGSVRVVGLAELVAGADELTLAEPTAMLRPAVWRLLAAVGYAAGVWPRDHEQYLDQIRHGIDVAAMGRYLDEHVAEFELFDPVRPFGQDAALRCAVGTDAERPAVYLDVTAAIDRPLLADDRHLAAARPLTNRQAAHALLVQHLWGFGGRTQGSVKELGPGASNYGIPSLASGRVVLCPEAGTVAQSLAWRLAPTSAPGQPWWSYPTPAPSGVSAVGGEAQGLTWPSRRLLLVPGKDGTVTGTVIARGMGYRDPASDSDPIVGWSDLLTTAKHKFLAGNAIVRPDDPVPLVAHFSAARHGSLLWHASRAASDLGHAPDLAAYSLVSEARGQKKAIGAHRVPIPGQALHVAAASEVARTLVGARRTTGAGPVVDDVPGFLDWLTAAPQELPGLLGATRRRLLRRIATHDVPYSRDVVERASAADKLIDKAETTLVGSTEEARHAMPDSSDDLASLFDDDLFVTTDDLGYAPPAKEGDEPGQILISRLVGYVNRPEHRGVLNRLADYARRPDLASAAMGLATRDLPVEHDVAATTVAALFAHAHQGKRRAALGRIPLPRLARSLGAGSRGPANTDVRIIMQRATRSPACDLLRTLRPLNRYLTQADDLRVDWLDLYRSVLAWDEPGHRARTRWSLLFYKSARVEQIDDLLAKGMRTR